MNLPFFIARRYLFSYKRHHAINIISRIAVVGVAVTTMALVCTLSVFNGFQELVASLFTSFDPELKVVPAQGKVIAADDPAVTAIRSCKDVAAATECLEGQALVRYGNRQSVVRIKGVDDNYSRTSDLSKILYGDGDFALKADVLYYGTPGLQLAAQLGLGVRYEYPLEVYAPRRGERISMVNPMESFNRDELHSPGVVFSVNQKKYDGEYILTSIDFTRRIFEQQGCISSLELKLKDGADIASVQKELGKLAGTKLKVLNRYEQQEDVFRIMRVEKLVAYIFLTFILVIACFNIIGSLSMLIIDKKDDVATLRHMGADDRLIERIFLFEGWLISTLGAVLGIVLGLGLCLAQQHFGLLKLGQSSGNFIIDAYPVSVRATDVVAVFVTVALVSFAAIWYPVRRLTRRLL